MQDNLSKQFFEVEMRLCKRLEQLKQDVMEFKIERGVNERLGGVDFISETLAEMDTNQKALTPRVQLNKSRSMERGNLNNRRHD